MNNAIFRALFVNDKIFFWMKKREGLCIYPCTNTSKQARTDCRLNVRWWSLLAVEQPARASFWCHEHARISSTGCFMAFLEDKEAFSVYVQLLELQIRFYSRFPAGPCRVITSLYLLAAPFPGQRLVLAAPCCSAVLWGFLAPLKS